MQIIIFGHIVWRKMIRGSEAEVMKSVTDFPTYESWSRQRYTIHSGLKIWIRENNVYDYLLYPMVHSKMKNKIFGWGLSQKGSLKHLNSSLSDSENVSEPLGNTSLKWWTFFLSYISQVHRSYLSLQQSQYGCVKAQQILGFLLTL